MGTLAGHPYITRAEWGARAPTAPLVLIRLPALRCYVHHLAAEQHGAQGMRDVQRFHQDTRGWKDIAYPYLVDDDGTIYEGRGHQWIGGHTTGQNSTSHAICLMGNFDQRKPTAAALQSLADLARHGIDHRWWAPNAFPGHRDAPDANTACPGRYLYAELPAVRAAIARPPTPPEEDPMAAFTEADLLRIAREAVRLELTTVGGDTRQAVHDLAADAVADELEITGSRTRKALVALLKGQIESEAAPIHQALDTWADGRVAAPPAEPVPPTE